MSGVWIMLPLAALAGPNTLLVGFDASLGASGVHRQAALEGGTASGCFHAAGVCAVHWAGSPPPSALWDVPGVRYVEADRRLDRTAAVPGIENQAPSYEEVISPPGDVSGTAGCPDLWDLAAIGLEAAWTAAGDQGVAAPTVAIEDAGFLLTHVDLLGQVSGQFDYGDLDTIPEVSWQAEVPGHGTFIGGVIAGVDDNGEGRVGIVPAGNLNLQKIADSDGDIYTSYAVAAMDDLADGDLGVGVLNYSLASSGSSTAFHDAVTALESVPILVVAAAGNCGSPNCFDADNDEYPLYPASYDDPHVVAVAGSTIDEGLNPYSHYGVGSVDVAAPGVDLCSLDADSDVDTTTQSGTSYATPLVAGVAALAWGAHPGLSVSELANLLVAAVEPAQALSGLVRAGGRLDAERVLTTAVPRLDRPPAVSVDQTGTLDLDIGNPAAAGDVIVVLFLDPGVEVGAGVDASLVDAGEAWDLPGVEGPVSKAAWLVRVTVEAHGNTRVEIPLRGLVPGTWRAWVRVIAATEGDVALASPTIGEGADPSGVIAWGVDIVVTQAASGGGDGGGSDTGEAAPAGCGCIAAGHPGGPPRWWLLAFGLVWAVGRGRRQR